MTNETLYAIQSFFGFGWEMITAFNLPGTNLTAAEIYVGIAVLTVVIRFITRFFGISISINEDVVTAPRRLFNDDGE